MGRILGPFGIQGWVKLKTFTESPDGLAGHPAWWLRTKAGWRSTVVEDFKVRPAAVSAKLEGVEDRNAAELLRGFDVAVTREDLGEAKEGEFYWVDLVGLAVVNLQGEALGQVEDLLRTGGSDVLVVRGERERLIPFVADYVIVGRPRGETHHGGLGSGVRRLMMRFDVVTIFPEMFEAVTRHGITRRALEEGGFDFRAWNPRDFVSDPHRTVDDRPYGGGPGMVMLPGPLEDCIDCAVARQVAAGVERPQVVLLSPQGERFTDAVARELAQSPGLVLLAGRYEGVDERLIGRKVDREISIGDYVTSGGELPAMVVMDAIVRLLPGSLNDAGSASQDSFSDGLLDWPHYTRPEEWKGERVPEVLLSGNHAAIAKWRRKQSLARTQARRPDLLEGRTLSKEDAKLLEEARREQQMQEQQ